MQKVHSRPQQRLSQCVIAPPAIACGGPGPPKVTFPDGLRCLQHFSPTLLNHRLSSGSVPRTDLMASKWPAGEMKCLCFFSRESCWGFLLSLLLFFSEPHKWQNIIISFILTHSCKSELFNIFLSNENAIYHYQMKC